MFHRLKKLFETVHLHCILHVHLLHVEKATFEAVQKYLFVFAIQDRHGPSWGNGFPSADVEQNIELVEGRECNNTTMLKFKRKIVSCDTEDRTITVSTFLALVDGNLPTNNRKRMRMASVADPYQVFGVSSEIAGAQKVINLFKYSSLSTRTVWNHTKAVTVCRPTKWLFCWSNTAIFQGITAVWKRFKDR